MRHPFALLAGALVIPLLVFALGYGGEPPERLGSGQVSFEAPAGATPGGDSDPIVLRDGDVTISYSPGEFPEELPERLDHDRHLEVDGHPARDVSLSTGGRYVRVVIVEQRVGFFTAVSSDGARTEADETLEELLRTVRID